MMKKMIMMYFNEDRNDQQSNNMRRQRRRQVLPKSTVTLVSEASIAALLWVFCCSFLLRSNICVRSFQIQPATTMQRDHDHLFRSNNIYHKQGSQQRRPLFGTTNNSNNDNDNHIFMSSLSRRDVGVNILSTFVSLSALTTGGHTVLAATDDTTVPFGAMWSSVDGLNTYDKAAGDKGNQNKKGFVSFDMAAYTAMKEDKSRTPFFRRAIGKRLNAFPPESQIVLDLGTGPFALFAIMAAELGAKKVYAIEADPIVAESARAAVQKSGWADTITVLEEFSTKITLTEKADLCIAEICGSIASEEGCIATIKDAHKRLMKNPNAPASWIPSKIQTFAAPASYTLHNLFGPPDFDWKKLAGEPIRFNCRDTGLQLLSDPVLVEDWDFSKINDEADAKVKKTVTFTVDAKRMKDAYQPLYDEFIRGRSTVPDSEFLARETSTSLSGIAMWPRLILADETDTDYIISSREYPLGGHQKSHWQTVLPIVSGRPIGNLKGGEKVTVDFAFDIPAEDIMKPATYQIAGNVNYVS